MMGPTVDVISAVTTAFLYVAIVDMAMSGGTASVGVLVAFTGYISRFWSPITTLAKDVYKRQADSADDSRTVTVGSQTI